MTRPRRCSSVALVGHERGQDVDGQREDDGGVLLRRDRVKGLKRREEKEKIQSELAMRQKLVSTKSFIIVSPCLIESPHDYKWKIGQHRKVC